jgi:hypothetical protein
MNNFPPPPKRMARLVKYICNRCDDEQISRCHVIVFTTGEESLPTDCLYNRKKSKWRNAERKE